jgi:hypothetical protein
MNKEAAKSGPYECTVQFPGSESLSSKNCGQKFEQRSRYVRHLSVDHEGALTTYRKVVEATLPLGGIESPLFEKCFLPDCDFKCDMNVTEFVVHLTESHFKADLLKELKDFQVTITVELIVFENHCIRAPKLNQISFVCCHVRIKTKILI